MQRIFFSLSLVIVGIAIGYIIQRLASRKTGKTSAEGLAPTRKNLQRIALLVLNPIAVVGATWVANLRSIQIVALPFLCLAALSAGGVLAYLFARRFRLNRAQTGAYLVCGSFTNIGSLGALFCFIFLGEKGFALVPIYKLFEEVAYFSLGFPLAKSYSPQIAAEESLPVRVRKIFTDPFVVTAMLGIFTGLLFNLSGLPRPALFGPVNAVLIPLAAFLLLVSIGMGMRFSSVGRYLREASAIAAIKFVLVPAFAVSAGYVLQLHTIDNGLPLQVVLVLASMPTAFTAMVPPTLYDLDVDLANGCWLLTNALLLVEVPLLAVLLPWMAG